MIYQARKNLIKIIQSNSVLLKKKFSKNYLILFIKLIGKILEYMHNFF